MLISTRTGKRTLYAVSDFRDGWPPMDDHHPDRYAEWWRDDPRLAEHYTYLNNVDLQTARAAIRVSGGYMERLPLALIRAGLIDYAEKWHYSRPAAGGELTLEQPLFGRRAFHLRDESAPYTSNEMIGFIRAHGAPDILCTYGLGVSESVLHECAESFKIYYSLDVPPLRVPKEVSQHFDLILVGAEWQREEVKRVHPDTAVEMLTLGPEFADDRTFIPLNTEKPYDLIYVACAQPYKRHDLLFRAMATLKDRGRPVRALCLIGYGDLRPEFERQTAELGIAVDFIGPPGVDFAEVNRLMNLAKIGIVASENDGCPAILTEYMLSDLPVLANSALCCGLRFIDPRSGLVASADAFPDAIAHMLDHLSDYTPRAHVQSHYTWDHSVRQFATALARAGYRRYSTANSGVE